VSDPIVHQRFSFHGVAMKSSSWIVLLVLSARLAGGQSPATASETRVDGTTSPVGMTTRDFVDPKRKSWSGSGPRPIATVIWYPAAPDAVVQPLVDPAQIRRPYPVARNAVLSPASRRYPLVVLSHGSTGDALAMMWLGDALAARGYVVAAVNHHGNTSAEKQLLPQGSFHPWERARDLSVLVDALLADSVFGARIDRRRIGAAGYSAGGYSAIALAGGVFNPQAIQGFCRSKRRSATYCDEPPPVRDALAKLAELRKTDPVVMESVRHTSDSYKDRRIKAVFAIAPALGPAHTEANLRRIRVPVEIVVGQSDEITPVAVDAQWYADHIPGARLTVLPGEVRHLTFTAECTAEGVSKSYACRDTGGVDRVAIHRQVSEMAYAFFERTWRRSERR
jgi:predicted dienelactone hydrolase